MAGMDVDVPMRPRPAGPASDPAPAVRGGCGLPAPAVSYAGR